MDFGKWDRELDRFEKRKSEYKWDELEELITDSLQEEQISMEEFERLMRRLMDLDCEL